MHKTKSVKLVGDSLFEGFIVRTILLDSEVTTRLHNGAVTKGFITGIDQQWLQVTDSHTTESKLLQIDSIQEINRTNRRISTLPKESRSQMKSMTHAIRTRCQEISSAGTRSSQVTK